MKLIQNYHSEISLSLSLPLSQLWAEVVGNLKKRKERVDSKTFLNQLHAFTFLYYMEERNERSQVKIATFLGLLAEFGHTDILTVDIHLRIKTFFPKCHLLF